MLNQRITRRLMDQAGPIPKAVLERFAQAPVLCVDLKPF